MADETERTTIPTTARRAADLLDINTRGALIAIAIALLAIAILIGTQVFQGSTIGNSPNSKKFQAVFLTNGQVYFGKLSGLGGAYASLNDVYYIQSGAPQPGASPAPSAQPNLSLVQLGQEIHGPEKQMQIASSQIVFWEDLKDDGKVVQAIKQQNAQGGQNNQNQGAPGVQPNGAQQPAGQPQGGQPLQNSQPQTSAAPR